MPLLIHPKIMKYKIRWKCQKWEPQNGEIALTLATNKMVKHSPTLPTPVSCLSNPSNPIHITSRRGICQSRSDASYQGPCWTQARTRQNVLTTPLFHLPYTFKANLSAFAISLFHVSWFTSISSIFTLQWLLSLHISRSIPDQRFLPVYTLIYSTLPV